MKFPFNATLFDIYPKYLENYAWLESIAKLPDNNRFNILKNKLQYITDNYSKNGFIKEMDRNEVHLTTYESIKFIDVVDYLKTLDQSQLPINKIKLMCIGPVFHLDEKPEENNSAGRDYQFEFILGSKLKSAGFNINKFDDIQFNLCSNVIRYECKRPSTIKSAKSGFDKAVDQLYRKIADNPKEFGVIAFSIERIDNFYHTLFTGNDIVGVMDSIVRKEKELIKSLRNNLKIGSDKKIIGLHICINSLLWDNVEGRFVPIEMHFTEKVCIEKKIQLYDFLYDEIRDKLEKDN
jgi:hypothetical protein